MTQAAAIGVGENRILRASAGKLSLGEPQHGARLHRRGPRAIDSADQYLIDRLRSQRKIETLQRGVDDRGEIFQRNRLIAEKIDQFIEKFDQFLPDSFMLAPFFKSARGGSSVDPAHDLIPASEIFQKAEKGGGERTHGGIRLPDGFHERLKSIDQRPAKGVHCRCLRSGDGIGFFAARSSAGPWLRGHPDGVINSVQQHIILQRIRVGFRQSYQPGFYDGHHRIMRPVGRRHGENGPDETQERMMRSRPAAIGKKWNIVFAERSFDQMLIIVLTAHENDDIAIAHSFIDQPANPSRGRIDLGLKVRCFDEMNRLNPIRGLCRRGDGRNECPFEPAQLRTSKSPRLLEQHRRRNLDRFLLHREPEPAIRALSAMEEAHLVRNMVGIVDARTLRIEREGDVDRGAGLAQRGDQFAFRTGEIIKGIDKNIGVAKRMAPGD